MVDTITQLITRTLELDEAATPGRWHVCGGSECTVVVSDATGEASDVDFQLMDEYRTAAPLLAKECQRLQNLHRPRDTRKGEWPEYFQKVLMWNYSWFPHVHLNGHYMMPIWLPAPPSPEDEA